MYYCIQEVRKQILVICHTYKLLFLCTLVANYNAHKATGEAIQEKSSCLIVLLLNCKVELVVTESEKDTSQAGIPPQKERLALAAEIHGYRCHDWKHW